MFSPIVSIAACAASSPLSAVFRPAVVGIVIGSYLHIEDVVAAGEAPPGQTGEIAGRVVADVTVAVGQTQQMVEEGELLVHQRAVDVMLALDLLEQAAQLSAERGGLLGTVGSEHGQQQ